MDDGQDIGTCLKEGSPGELEIDEDMEMEEGSGGEDDEEEVVDPGSSPSPEQQMALGHGTSDQAGPSGIVRIIICRNNFGRLNFYSIWLFLSQLPLFIGQKNSMTLSRYIAGLCFYIFLLFNTLGKVFKLFKSPNYQGLKFSNPNFTHHFKNAYKTFLPVCLY